VRHKTAKDGTDGVASTKANPILWKSYVFFFQDAKDQGHQAVHAARLRLLEEDKKKGFIWRILEEWSDGCAEQFKCAGALMDLADMRMEYKDTLKIIRKCFHCAGHGKTEGDGAGGQKKQMVMEMMIHGEHEPCYCNNAADVVTMLEREDHKAKCGPKASTYKSVIEATDAPVRTFTLTNDTHDAVCEAVLARD
jgi:hypothetical protein